MASHPEELTAIYDEHAPALFAFLLNLVRNEADTRDLLQELFIKLARQPLLLEGIRDHRAFLLRLAHNAAIDLIRRREARQRHTDILAEEQAATLFLSTTDADEKEFRGALGAALAELPPDQRAVVHLKLWEQSTFEAIAEVLQISPNTAASRYRYGIDKLRDRLRPLYDELK